MCFYCNLSFLFTRYFRLNFRINHSVSYGMKVPGTFCTFVDLLLKLRRHLHVYLTLEYLKKTTGIPCTMWVIYPFGRFIFLLWDEFRCSKTFLKSGHFGRYIVRHLFFKERPSWISWNATGYVILCRYFNILPTMMNILV